MTKPAFDVFSPHLAPSMAESLQRYALKDGEVQTPKPHYPGQRRVVCAANKEADGKVIVGARHHDMVMNNIYIALGIKGASCQIQGFIDNYGVFLTREEAWKVAFDAGQIIRRCGSDRSRLFSENLY